ncbi:MAG: DUF456 domain-containing protein [Gemmatimonadaceae bacterium]
MAFVLLIAAILLGLLMIPLGMPGTLVIFAAALCYRILIPLGGIGTTTVLIVGIMTALAEALEWVLSSRFSRRYGGSKRAGWGAIIGGMVGAVMGVPVPIVGSIVGAFLGAFVGAFALEFAGHGGMGQATKVAWGALLGRMAATALKIGIGIAMAVLLVAAAGL